MQGNVVSIEVDQRLPCFDPLPRFNAAGESFAGEIHRVQADMHQHLHTRVTGDGERVPAGLHIADHTGQRCAER